jgi:hypothetical protein
MMAVLSQTLSSYASNASNNIAETFSRMTMEKWIRIVIIVGAYALLRPYLMKLGARLQQRQHEKEDEADQAKAQMSANQLRGIAEIPDDTDDEADGDSSNGVTAQSTAADWGKKARRRQRRVLKQLIDAEDERLRQAQEDDEDKDIEEFLIPE